MNCPTLSERPGELTRNTTLPLRQRGASIPSDFFAPRTRLSTLATAGVFSQPTALRCAADDLTPELPATVDVQ